jgi:hypothetical protein
MEGGTGFEPVNGDFADHSVSLFATRPQLKTLKFKGLFAFAQGLLYQLSSIIASSSPKADRVKLLWVFKKEKSPLITKRF